MNTTVTPVLDQLRKALGAAKTAQADLNNQMSATAPGHAYMDLKVQRDAVSDTADQLFALIQSLKDSTCS